MGVRGEVCVLVCVCFCICLLLCLCYTYSAKQGPLLCVVSCTVRQMTQDENISKGIYMFLCFVCMSSAQMISSYPVSESVHVFFLIKTIAFALHA